MPLADQVLIVDDDPGFHRLVESVLVPTGVPCQAVRTGEEALKLLEKDGPPKAVIIDGLLPGMRGDDVAAKIRERWKMGELPVVFVSAFFRDLRSRQRLLNTIKVDAVLHKPVSVEDLKRTLARFPALSPQANRPINPEEELELDITTAVELLTDYLVLAEERIISMRQAMADLGGEDPKVPLKQLRTEAHRFRGTGTSFGLPEVTRLGAQMEDLIERYKDKLPPPGAIASLAGMLEALEVKLARAGASVPAPGTGNAARPLRVLVVDGAGELATSISEATGKGLPLRLFHDLEEAVTSALEEAADVVFVAGDRPGIDGLKAAARFQAEGIGPVVLMAADGSLAERLKALSKGVRGYVHRLPDAEALLKLAPDFAAPPKGLSALAVGSDAAQLGTVAETLSAEGVSVTPCLEPKELFEQLDQLEPALLIVSAETKGFNGLQLVRAVRGDARHGQLPIVVLAKGDGRKERIEAFDAGADDVLSTPVNSDELIARIHVQVRRRGRELRTVSQSLPGFLGLAGLKVEVARALSLARRGRTLAVLAFEGQLEALHQARGRLEADAAVAALGARLRSGFRTSDVVAHLGGARFGVLLHDAAKADAQRLLAQHLGRFNEGGPFDSGLPMMVKGAMASFPEVRSGADALIAAALEGLTAKK
ncbi:MAG: response regulator [Myxococcaceae bacterium]|nr:response regulator [Myxococcaceae bacterium]